MTTPNGLNTYYTYDELGRLHYAQDHRRRITDEMRYHYQGQPHPR